VTPSRGRLSAALAALVLAGCAAPAASGPASPPASPSLPTVPGSRPPPTGAPSPDATPSTSPSEPGVDPGALAWSPVEASGDAPAAREDHTWTLEPDARVAWLFGGRDGGTVLDDLWRYDLATDTWARQEADGDAPAARLGHTATWVDGVGLVVWSGQSSSGFFDDLWAFDPASNAWRELPADGPVPKARYGSCAALGPDGRLWISHGFTADSGRFADTWAYDFAAGRWTETTPGGDLAPIRCLHDCLWTPDGRLVIYAGQTTGTPAIGDLWARPSDGAWTAVSDGPPPARQLYALTSVDSTAFVFGGGSKDGGTLRDLWLLDLATLAWTEGAPSGDRPSGRSGATFVADPSGGRLLLFGGKREGAALGDVWQLSIGG
jgi:hypothetical protein